MTLEFINKFKCITYEELKKVKEKKSFSETILMTKNGAKEGKI